MQYMGAYPEWTLAKDTMVNACHFAGPSQSKLQWLLLILRFLSSERHFELVTVQ